VSADVFDEDLSSFKISKKHHSEMPTIYIDDPSFSLYFILSRLGIAFSYRPVTDG
jgi:hypothetical protein